MRPEQRLIEGESFDLTMNGGNVDDTTSHYGDDDEQEDLDEVDTVLREGTHPPTDFMKHQTTQFIIGPLAFIFLAGLTVLGLCAKHLDLTSHAWIGSITFPQRPGVKDEGYMPRLERLEAQIFAISRDWVGMQDFALRYNGGRVIDGLTTKPMMPDGGYPANDPVVALDDDIRPGQCWRVDRSSAQLGIQLRRPVSVTNITIDHVPKELVSGVHNAPRNIMVWGQPTAKLDSEDWKRAILAEERRDPALQALTSRPAPLISDGPQLLPLAFLEYDVHARDNIQTFSAFDATVKFNVTCQLIVFDILDNWGATSLCLYRVRVHGNDM